MKFEDYFNIDLFLFTPKVFYEGTWLLGGFFSGVYEKGDYLVINSKVKGNNNLYKKFLEENYYKKLANIFNSSDLANFFIPRIILDIDDDTNKRTISYSFDYFLMRYVSSLIFVESPIDKYYNIVSKNNTRAVALQVVYDMIREERKAYSDIKKNGKNSIYYEKLIDVIPTIDSNKNLEELIDGLLEPLCKFCIRRNDLLDFFKKKVDTKKLLECFDFDKFCLIAAQGSIEQCYDTEKNHNLVDNSIVYIKSYLEAVEKYRVVCPKYNPSIIVYDEKGKKRKKYLNEIELEYRSLLARHPEFRFYEIEDSKLETIFKRYGKDQQLESTDFSSQEGAKVLESLVYQLLEDQELATSWEFIPKGKREVSENTHNITKMYDSITEDEAVRRMIIGRKFFLNSNYIVELRGINNFAGYVGYIYPNGTVAFEKFYENEQTHRVARDSATYIMDVSNFIELSKYSKSEIIDMLKHDKSLKVKRIFHYKDMNRWIKNVSDSITGQDYSDEIMEYINTLIENNTLHSNKNKQMK